MYTTCGSRYKLIVALFNYVIFILQNNRVTMKIDVSYTDHSHIIGKVSNYVPTINTLYLLCIMYVGTIQS